MKRYFTLLILFTITFSSFGQTAMSIADAKQVDSDGSLVNLGELVELTGITIGPNLRSSGHTWLLVDPVSEVGITAFAFNNDANYSVTDGDLIKIIGELDEFNGLGEIVVDSVVILSQGNTVPNAKLVTSLDESTEGYLVKLENVYLADSMDWEEADFNVDVTNGTDTFQLRIDGDTELANLPFPRGTFSVSGNGGQYDPDVPYNEGYQLFPRYISDFDPYDMGQITGPTYEKITLMEAREVDGDLASTRIGETIEVSGIVHGINFRPNGLQFTIIDENNIGLGIFNSSGQLNYSFTEGDEIGVQGTLVQFNGLTQMNPDSIWVISTGNDLVMPRSVGMLSESTESSLIRVQMAGFVDETDWPGDGSSFNIDFYNINGEVLTMRIDEDTELANLPIPDGHSFVTGIGGQYDDESPFNSGYQIFPWLRDQFDAYLSVEDQYEGNVVLSPNPTSDIINIEADQRVDQILLFNLDGKLIINDLNSTSIDLKPLTEGMYILKLYFGEEVYIEKVVKK